MIIYKNKLSHLHLPAYIVACSVIGNGKIENQDSVEIRNTNDGIIVVVADGLGSAAYSKEGSERAVKITADLLEKEDFEDLPEKILINWKKNLQGNLNQYDTTVKFIYISSTKVFVGGIGDGWISLKNNMEVKNFIENNVFSNQTDTILSFDLENRFWINEYEKDEFDALLISTDGFSEDIEKDNAFEFLSQVKIEMINNLDVFALDLDNTLLNWPIKSNRDDKTVVFIVFSKEDTHE